MLKKMLDLCRDNSYFAKIKNVFHARFPKKINKFTEPNTKVFPDESMVWSQNKASPCQGLVPETKIWSKKQGFGTRFRV